MIHMTFRGTLVWSRGFLQPLTYLMRAHWLRTLWRCAPFATIAIISVFGRSDDALAWITPEDTIDAASLPLSSNKNRSLASAPTRMLSFTVTEGTWMSLDVSPDGKSLIFDLLGDLYLVSVEGGHARRITTGIAFDSQPRFSPNGRSVVFISDRSGDENVWILDLASQQAKQVSRDIYAFFTSPDWSPDGGAIIVSKDLKDRAPGASGRYAPQLWVYDVDSPISRRLEPYPSAPRWFGATYTPSGAAIIATAATERVDVDAEMPMTAIYSIDAETSEATVVAKSYGGAMRPSLSPDGRWMAYGARVGADSVLRLRDLQSGADVLLLEHIDRDHQETVPGLDFLPGAAFSPDSRFLFIAIDGGLKRVSIPNGDVSEISFVADVELQIGPEISFGTQIDDGPVTATQVRDPVLSPDGKQLVFSAFQSVWLVRLPTGAAKRLSPANQLAQHPSWSPDGRSIYYVTWNYRSGGQVFVVGAQGGGARQITKKPAFYAYPVAVQDEFLAVWQGSAFERASQLQMGRRQPEMGVDLKLITLATAEAETIHRLTTRCHGDSYGSCIPKLSVHELGRRIAFLNKAGEMVSVSAIGEPKRKLFSAEGLAYIFFRRAEAAPADQAVLSADGRHALVRTGAHLYLIHLPVNAATPAHYVLTVDEGEGFRKVNDVGGEFPAFAAEGHLATFALGPSVFQIDVDRFSKNGRGITELRPAVTLPRFLPVERLLLRNARLITMKGDEIIDKGDILIEGTRIVAIDPAGELTAPDGTKVLDVAGKTIIPGLVDVHMHVAPPPDLLSLQSWDLAANLAYGITTGLDPAPHSVQLSYADLIEVGYTLGPRLFSTGPIIGFDEGIRLVDLDDARTLVRRFAEYYSVPMIKQYLTGNRRDQQLLAIAAWEQEIGATSEGGATGYKYWLSQLLDGYPRQEHNLMYPLYDDVKTVIVEAGFSHSSQMLTLRSEGGPSVIYSFFEDEARLATKKARRFLPTPWRVANVSRRRWSFDASELVHERWAHDIADLIARGGNVALGNHGNVPGLGTHWEMQALATGVENHDVLRMATIMGARHIGMQADLGSLEVGKLADMLVLADDPLDDIRNTEKIEYVIKGGAVYNAESLQIVWPDVRTADALQ